MKKFFQNDWKKQLLKKHLLKQYQLNFNPTENEERILQSIGIIEQGHLVNCCKLLKTTDLSLMSARDYGIETVKWLIRQSDKYSAKSLFNSLNLLEKYRLINLRVFKQFSEVMDSFEQAESGKMFLELFNGIIKLTTYSFTSDLVGSSAFDILLSLKGKEKILPLLRDIYSACDSYNTSSYLENHLKELCELNNPRALNSILNIIKHLKKSGVVNRLFSGQEMLTYFTYSEWKVRNEASLELYSQLLTVLDKYQLLTEYNLGIIKGLEKQAGGLASIKHIIQTAQHEGLTQRVLDAIQDDTPIKNTNISLMTQVGMFQTSNPSNRNSGMWEVCSQASIEEAPPSYKDSQKKAGIL
jgi:hypothetical protein